MQQAPTSETSLAGPLYPTSIGRRLQCRGLGRGGFVYKGVTHGRRIQTATRHTSTVRALTRHWRSRVVRRAAPGGVPGRSARRASGDYRSGRARRGGNPTQAPAAAASKPTQAPAAPASNQTAASKPAQAPAAAQGVRGGTLTVALSAEPVDMDPANTGGTPTAAAEQLIYNALVRNTPEQTVRPDLALSWTAEDDKWTFKLRQGVKFHDGTPFNAAAVKYTFDRYLVNAEKVRRAGDWQPYLESVTVVDDSTVQFKTKGIDAFFLARLGNEVGIVSPTAHAKLGKDYLKAPVGTGPFKFKEWIPGVSFTAVRNDEYFGDKAFLDQVIMRPIPEAATRAIALETGEVQLATPITPEQMGRLQTNSSVKLVSRATTLNLMFGLNNVKKPFDDVRVRQALNYAIDRDAIVKNVYSGLAEALNGAIPKAALGYAPVEGYAFDPPKSKQMLADAGLPNGFTASMTGHEGPLLQGFRADASRAAIPEGGRRHDQHRDRRMGALPRSWSASRRPRRPWRSGSTASMAARPRLAQSALELQRRRADWPECARLLRQRRRPTDGHGRPTLDDKKRDELVAQAQQLISKDAPSIWAWPAPKRPA